MQPCHGHLQAPLLGLWSLFPPRSHSFPERLPTAVARRTRTKATCWFCSWGEETTRLCQSSVPETLLGSRGPEQAGLWDELVRLICNGSMEIHILCHFVNLLSDRKSEPVAKQWQEVTGSCQSPHTQQLLGVQPIPLGVLRPARDSSAPASLCSPPGQQV